MICIHKDKHKKNAKIKCTNKDKQKEKKQKNARVIKKRREREKRKIEKQKNTDDVRKRKFEMRCGHDIARRRRQAAEGVWARECRPGTQTMCGGFLNTKCAVVFSARSVRWFSHGEKITAVRNSLR